MKQVLIGVGTLTLIATLATVGLWLAGYPVAAALIGAGAFFSWLALLVVGTVAVTTLWSASLMERGAQLALRSQESDDRRDIAQMRAFALLSRTMFAVLRGQQQPMLPLPSQDTEADWLPQLAEYNEVDGD